MYLGAGGVAPDEPTLAFDGAVFDPDWVWGLPSLFDCLPTLSALRCFDSASSSEKSRKFSGTSVSSFHDASEPRCLKK